MLVLPRFSRAWRKFLILDVCLNAGCLRDVPPENTLFWEMDLNNLNRDIRGVHFRTPNRLNLEKTPIFSGALMETIQTFPKQLVDLLWPNSICSKTSQMSFDLFNCCLWHHLHCQDVEHFFAELSAGKANHFFGGRISSTARVV